METCRTTQIRPISYTFWSIVGFKFKIKPIQLLKLKNIPKNTNSLSMNESFMFVFKFCRLCLQCRMFLKMCTSKDVHNFLDVLNRHVLNNVLTGFS